MTVRKATVEDLDQIYQLAQEFGHLMTYMQIPEGIQPHLQNIIVHETEDQSNYGLDIDGFFHYRPILDMNDVRFIEKEKTIPEFLMDAAFTRSMRYTEKVIEESPGGAMRGLAPLAVCMQGGSHREVFHELITSLQKRFSEIWCWCSIKSNRPDGYRQLGFSFNPKIEYTFYNPHVQRESTYQLGRWNSGTQVFRNGN